MPRHVLSAVLASCAASWNRTNPAILIRTATHFPLRVITSVSACVEGGYPSALPVSFRCIITRYRALMRYWSLCGNGCELPTRLALLLHRPPIAPGPPTPPLPQSHRLRFPSHPPYRADNAECRQQKYFGHHAGNLSVSFGMSALTTAGRTFALSSRCRIFSHLVKTGLTAQNDT